VRSIIFCEAVAIYGVIVAIILSTRLESPFAVRDTQTGLFPIQAMTAGYAIYGSGITTGWSNLVCGCAPAPACSCSGGAHVELLRRIACSQCSYKQHLQTSLSSCDFEPAPCSLAVQLQHPTCFALLPRQKARACRPHACFLGRG